MTTNKTVKAQAEELSKKFIKAESVDMYDDSKLTDLIEGFLTKLTEAEKEAAHQTDMACQCDIAMGRITKRLEEAEKVIDAADEYVRIGDRYGVSRKMKLKEALTKFKEARE